MSTSSIRRDRDDRTGETATDPVTPDTVNDDGTTKDTLEIESSSADLVEGGGVSENDDPNRVPEAEAPRAAPDDNTAQAAADELERAESEHDGDVPASSFDTVEGADVVSDEDDEAEGE